MLKRQFFIHSMLMIDFLEEFLPEDLDFLNQVYDPGTQMTYQYEDSFTERIFDEKHNEHLKLLSNQGKS